MDWLIANKDWVFSGIGVLVLTVIGGFIKNKLSPSAAPQTAQTVNQSVVLQSSSLLDGKSTEKRRATPPSLPERKAATKIVFVDDDTKFKVVKILATSGWLNTSIIKDVKSLDDPVIVDAHILFIDVQGVGVAMGFDSEGLGLSMAIKNKYPEKKIVIYSTETKGDRFHEALRRADSFLAKNADPYEFQKLVEELSLEVNY
ncbi:hypothetical protein [Rhodoferax lacus]|uniref:hypothetical protein n=1 Tax=Rhodoferax lacus TaxID=2184758 RepID=UPI0011C12A58|nr:hypothetical protein [Rhodoferax lacus]